MDARSSFPFLLSAALALGGCTVTATGGGGTTTVSGGADGQLRASVRAPLRRAGVSDACINSLSTSELTQVRNRTQRSPRTSKEVLQRNQQLRVLAERFCADL